MKKSKLQNQLRGANAAGADISKGEKFDFSDDWYKFSKIMSHCESLNLKKQIPFLKKVLEKLHPLTFRKRISYPFYRIVNIGNGVDGRSSVGPSFTTKNKDGSITIHYLWDGLNVILKLKHDIEGEIEKIERELKELSHYHFPSGGYSTPQEAIKKFGRSKSYFYRTIKLYKIKSIKGKNKSTGAKSKYYKNSDLKKLPK